MTRLRDIEGAELVSASGSRLGTVERVLFHPAEPRAVALMVRPDPALVVVSLPPAYVPWADVTFGDAVRMSSPKLPVRKATEKTLGFDMDTSVIWRGMPVADVAGGLAGSVADVGLREDGTVELLELSSGGVGDVAYGRIPVPGDAVVGFADGRVTLRVRASALEPEGGLAKAAAESASAAKAAAATVASATGEAVVDASYIAGRAIRSVVRAQPLARTKSAFRGIADAFREGYEGDDTSGPAADGDRSGGEH